MTLAPHTDMTDDSPIHPGRLVRAWLASLVLVAMLALLIAPNAIAQDDPPEDEAQTQEQADGDTEKEKADDEKKPEDRYLAITGGRVHTVSGPVLPGATILAKNGVIEAVGHNVVIPEEAEVIDATGYRVYPGLIAVRSARLVGGGSAEDTTDIFDISMAVALAGGLTTVVSGDDAVKLTFGTNEDMTIRKNLFTTIRYNSNNPAGKRELRKKLDRVQKHLRELRKHELEKQSNPDAEPPDDKWVRGEYQRYMQLLKGEATAFADADSAHDMRELCFLAERYGIRFVIQGGVEAWTMAPELARAGADLFITPRERNDPEPELMRRNGSTIENAAILNDHGVRFSFIPVGSLFGPGYTVTFGGLAGRDLLHLPMEAAFAVRGGLPEDAAVRAITLDAAKILGIDDQIGSIEVGKDADFVITDGDLLHYMTLTRWTIVNGRVAYDKAKDSLFDHIRPAGDQDAPPPDDHWPRRLGEEW